MLTLNTTQMSMRSFSIASFKQKCPDFPKRDIELFTNYHRIFEELQKPSSGLEKEKLLQLQCLGNSDICVPSLIIQTLRDKKHLKNSRVILIKLILLYK